MACSASPASRADRPDDRRNRPAHHPDRGGQHHPGRFVLQGRLAALEQNNTKGLTRAFDAKTGKLIWTFHNIPQQGEPGYDSWEKNSADFNGNTGTWTGITVDPECKPPICRSKTPPTTPMAAAVRATTSMATAWWRRSQHRQAEMVFPGRPSPDLGLRHVLAAVADGRHHQRTAEQDRGRAGQGSLPLYVRPQTGKPIWPIIEKPVPQSDVPGEKTPRPSPSRPSRRLCAQQITTNDLIDFTPEMRARRSISSRSTGR